MAAWIIVGILSVLLLFVIALYRRSVRQFNHLLTFTLFAFLDESVYRTQSDGLKKFISSTAANNALELTAKVRASATQLADSLAADITLGCHSAIWNLRRNAEK